MNKILFYKVKDPHGYMSNFSRHGFLLDGQYWPTSEHYYQAQKFTDPELQKLVRECPTPKLARDIGNDRSKPIRPDWDQVRDSVMLKALFAKFEQNSDIEKQLLETDNAVLVEHSSNDFYWADGGDGSGKNVLGQQLMQVRREIKQQLRNIL